MGVTKTDYMRGMQCPRMLWLDRHRPEERIIPPEVQKRLDEGNAFGDAAMGMFGEYVETTAFKENGKLDFAKMLEKTQECLQNGTPVICEAAFRYYGNYCAVDILRKVGEDYELYEVKNSSGVSEQFIKDVGFQRYILIRCGIRLKKCCIVYHGEDEANPYVIEDVSEKAKAFSETVNDNIWRLGKIKFQKEEVMQEPGSQCNEPYECWYYDYCHRPKE